MNEKKVAGVLAAVSGISAIAYFLTRKKPVPPPQKYKCPHCDETFGTYAELLAHIEAKHPGTLPPQLGYITGYVVNKVTGAKIPNATIYLDWALDCYSDGNGAYATSYTKYGDHTLVVEADNYAHGEFQVTTSAQVTTLDLQLDPYPVTPPGQDWIDDINIKQMVLTPATVYPGQEVQIMLDASYRCGAPRPIVTTGRLHIDGEVISKEFEVGYYNPSFYFYYTPQFPGKYTITSGGAGTTLTVLKEEVAHYYSPFGGVKWPLVTDIIIPDVAPFTAGSFVHPGGDLKYSDIKGMFGYQCEPGNWPVPFTPVSYVTWFPICEPFGSIPQAQLSNARPAATDIPGCPMDKFAIKLETWRNPWGTSTYPGIIIVITDKQGCGDHWESKEALAQMIGRTIYRGEPYYPTNPIMFPEITPVYKTCWYCGGSGRRDCAVGRILCNFCYGQGYIWAFDIYKGISDWTWPPFVYSDCRWASRDQHHYSVYCPYCQGPFTTGDLGSTAWYETDNIAWARQFLQHIEDSHPTHPLTEPAWF